MLQPRPYQQASVDACWDYLSSSSGNPLLVLPTGAGKSLVMAMLCQQAAEQWGCRIAVLAHVKELIEQNANEIKSLAPSLNVGIYSAGLKRRDKGGQVLVAGIQSVYRRAFDLDVFDLALIDEAHLVPPEGEGMYRQFIADALLMNPKLRIIGLTATPYRTSTGLLYGQDQIFADVAYEAGVADLIEQGYLCPLTSKEGAACDTSGLHVRGGEYIEAEAEALMIDTAEVACRSLVASTANRKSVLVFCSGVQHATIIRDHLRRMQSDRVEQVTGDTPAGQRDAYTASFKSGAIRYLVNVNVLTTGFNAPNVDCVALLRPTLSPGLYYQMVGRGFRLWPGKSNCLVLDFGGNVLRHGPVDAIEPKNRRASSGGGDAPVKVCPQCLELVPASKLACPDCQHEFPPPDIVKHDSRAGDAPITTLETIRKTHAVTDVRYNLHKKRGDPEALPTLRVEYGISAYDSVSEWVCIEHDGYAGSKAKAWWAARSNDKFPTSTQQAVDIADGGGLAIPELIVVEHKGGEKFPRIVRVQLGPKPEGVAREDSDFDFASVAGDAAPEPEYIDYNKLFDDAPF